MSQPSDLSPAGGRTREHILAALNKADQFAYVNGIFVTHISPGHASGELRVRPDSFNPNGIVHGGALFTLGDTVAGAAAVFGREQSCVTVNSSIEYLRPALGPVVLCEASPKKEGRSFSVMQVTMTSQQGKFLATGTYTYFFQAPPREKEGEM